jgi:predicted signal transduction protein with EAL and GGDEF domain
VSSNHQSAAIVRSVLGLGSALKIPVIAEGVETDAERSFLQEQGCQEIQGYLVGRPLPISSYAELTGGLPLPRETHLELARREIGRRRGKHASTVGFIHAAGR